MGKTNTTIQLIVILILTVLVIFVPGAKDTIFVMFTNSENFQPIHVDLGDFDIKWDIKFELPSLQIDAESTPILNISVPFLIATIVIALFSIILSYWFSWTTLILTVLFGVVGLYFSFQATNVYEILISNGNTSWDAACSCFGILFCLYLVVMTVGLLNLISTILIGWLDDAVPRYIFGTLIALIVSALGSLIVSGLCLLTLGFGWSGGIFLFLAIAFVIAMVGEFANARLHSGSIADTSQYSTDNYDYEYDYDTDYLEE